MGMACGTKGEKRKAYRILVGKPEGKRSIGRPRCMRWVGLVARMEKRNAYRILVGKPEGKNR
jgi:hypothetical protein